MATATLRLEVGRLADEREEAELVETLDAALTECLRLRAASPTNAPRLGRLSRLAEGRGVKVCGPGRSASCGPRDNAPRAASPERSAPRGAMTLAEREWLDAARSELTDRPDRRLRLGDLLPPAALPDWPCALPWTRLEISPGGWLGPCCYDYQALSIRVPRTSDPAGQWNGEAMRAYRNAMVGGGHPPTCKVTCPLLTAGSQRPADVLLRGGPRPAVESQLATLRAMLRGEEFVPGSPLELCLAATTSCNYDCVMCDYGETGTLEDELPGTFWEALGGLLRGVFALEINGGEPLASPALRDFLATLDRTALPQLGVLLVTNGSYLGPRQLDRWARAPLAHLTISLNAASDATYAAVNRGLPMARVRPHLAEIAARRRDGRLRAGVQYSMVLVRDNIHEIEAFADLAQADGASVRYHLPLRNRHGSSIMTDRGAMLTALRGLQLVGGRLLRDGRLREARGVLGNSALLWRRLADGILAPL